MERAMILGKGIAGMRQLRAFIAAIALLAAFPLLGEIKEVGNALFSFEEQKFGFFHWGKGWSSFDSHLSYPHLIEYAGMPDQDASGERRRIGTFKVYTGKFDFVEKFRKISENEAEFTFEFHSATGVPTEQLAYATIISLDFYRNNPLSVDGKTIPAGKGFYQPGGKETVVQLPLPSGVLELRGNFGVGVQFSDKDAQLRLLLNAGGDVKDTTIKFHAKFTPAGDSRIDLRPAMNRDLIDEAADDKTGGWTDQGPNNDMRVLPVGIHDAAGIPFEIVDPAQNHRKGCIALRGEMRPYFAETAAVSVPNLKGRYLYLLNGLAWGKQKQGEVCGEIVVRYADGGESAIEVKSGVNTADFWNPMQLEEALVGWQSRNEAAPVGLYASWFKLDPEKEVTGLEFRSRGQVWMILAATISSKFPDEQSLIRKERIVAGGDWLPLDFKREVEKDSVLDLSRMTLDAPAGKYGFLRVGQDGSFEFEKQPGKKARFWGTNLCFGLNYLTKQESIQMLDDLVKLGYNSIRPHHFDCGNNGIEPNDLVWDRFDFMLAEAKKRGIYITTDLYTVRSVTLKTWGHVTEPEFKWLCYFDDEAYANLLEFSKYFLCHVNPYTGLALKDDPAFICLSLINESSLMIRVHQLTDKTRPLMEKEFEKWCRQKGYTDKNEKLKACFLTDSAKKLYARLKKDLRDMGVKIPLTDQNMVFHIPTQIARLDYDYVDSHFYWGHPINLTEKSGGPWRTNSQSIISDWGGEFRDSVSIRIFGKPNVITEWNYCWPNPTCAEEQIIMPASAALQGFDGLWHFGYGHGKNLDVKAINVFDIMNNPVKRLGARMGSLLFLRGDVAESEVILPYDHTQKFSGLAQLSLIAQTGMLDPSNPRFTQKPIPGGLGSEELVLKLMEQGRLPKDSYDKARRIARSTTGEIETNYPDRSFTVKTPRSEVFVLPEGKSAQGKFLSANVLKHTSVIGTASLDGNDLTASKRILLLHLTQNVNKGTVLAAPEMNVVYDEGKLGVLVKRGVAELKLAGEPINRIYACSVSGKRLFEVPFKQENGTACFTVDTKSPEGAILVYEVLRE